MPYQIKEIIDWSVVISLVCYLCVYAILVSLIFSKRYRLILTILIIVVLFGGTLVYSLIETSYTVYYSEFTSQKWEEFTEYRYLMIESLQEKHLFVGMTKEEIRHILGEEDVNPYGDMKIFNSVAMYFIHDSSFLIHIERDYFVIYFDGEGVVEKTEIITYYD